MLKPLLLFTVIVLCVNSVHSVCNRTALWNVTVIGHYDILYRAEKFTNKNITTMANYYKLDVQWANISALCEGMINNFPRLNTITLINLNITEVENQAFQAPNLQHLSLALNKLTAVKKGQYNNVKSLRTIYLSANQIEYIEEDAFDDMPWLQRIHVDRNKIREINGNWFLNSPQIRVVELSFNMIVYVPAEAFKHLLPSHKHPIEYYLDNNRITDISDGAVDNKQPLVLHLRHNNISYISASLFSNLRAIYRLHLEDNAITCLDDQVLQQMNSTIMSLYLDDNPIDCECVRKFNFLVKQKVFTIDFYYKSSLNC